MGAGASKHLTDAAWVVSSAPDELSARKDRLRHAEAILTKVVDHLEARRGAPRCYALAVG